MDVGAAWWSLGRDWLDVVLVKWNGWMKSEEVFPRGVRTEREGIKPSFHEMLAAWGPKRLITHPILERRFHIGGVRDEEDAVDGGIFVESDVGSD
jgi:hypothetical protein